jgi:choline transporter-like protein 2/4/5
MVMERYVADLLTAWVAVVVCGLVCPVVLSFIFLALMRYFTGLFVWMTIILVNLLAIALTVFTFVKAGVIGEDEISAIAGENSKQTLEDAAGVVRARRFLCPYRSTATGDLG